MKNHIIALTLLASSFLHAENLELKNGKILKDYRVLNHTAVDAMVIHEGGAENISFELFPDDLQKKYKYNPKKAEEYKQKTEEKQKEAEKRRQEQLKEYKRELAEKEALANAVRLRGEIRQIVDEGMLIFAHYGNERMPRYDTGKDRPKLTYGDFLLRGHPMQKQKVDDDWFDVDAIPDGTYEYQTITGANKRIRAFKVVKAYK